MEDKKPTKLEKIYKLFVEPPVAYNAGLARLLGSAKAAILLAQLIYWTNKGRWGAWVYKTMYEIEEETCLSRHEQETAIRRLKKLNLLEVQLRGIPATRHFKVNFPALEDLIMSSPLSPNTDGGKDERPLDDFEQSISDTNLNNNQIRKPIKKMNKFKVKRRKEAMEARTKLMTKRMSVRK